MRHLRPLFFFLILWQTNSLFAQVSRAGLMVEPFQNRVLIEEKGQFADKAESKGMNIFEPILYALENAEFNAYFTSTGINFQFAERKIIPKEERVKIENEPEERGTETTWHSVKLNLQNANADVQVSAARKAHEYYNYSGIGSKPNINFVPAYNELIYTDIYNGIDLIFELPESGGIKYRFEVEAGANVSQIALKWEGIESLQLDENGGLLIKSFMALMADKAPEAHTTTGQDIPINYAINGNNVRFNFSENTGSFNEKVIIDPWIINTSFLATNRAYDIQEDAAGNVVIHGNTTNYQVQKYSPTGVLQWTYTTNSVFLGDIAVDNPGNVYIVGGYPAGKRQKLDSNGVQIWNLAGLVEEWRLAFNHSKTVLTIGGYFLNPGGNNLALLNTNTGAISNQIIYGLETRAIATDCNGDMYSLHVDFGLNGTANGNLLQKTNADFTPAGVMPSGFLLAEAELTIGYAPNPDYITDNIYQGFNGLIVSGLYVYISDGATLRRVDKQSLTILNSATVPGGLTLRNSGLSADLCGNIYAGSQNGIVKYDSLLNFIETIPTTGAVYDIIFASTNELLVSGAGFLGSFVVNCVEPDPVDATVNNACDGTGSISVLASGGLSPYTYEWQPGGQTTPTLTGLPAGTYTYTVNDAFCRTFTGTSTIYENPVATAITTNSSGNPNNTPNSVCLGDTIFFTDNSSSVDGNVVNWQWDFGDGNTSVQQNSAHVYASDGQFDINLTVITEWGCSNTGVNQITVHPLPSANFTASEVCLNDATDFADTSTPGAGNIDSWNWNFGDTQTSTDQNPSHTYATDGSYPVKLIVITDNGCTDTTVQNVQSYALPQADFAFPVNCLNDPMALIDGSVDGDFSINNWIWTIDGTTTLNGANGQYLFSSDGSFPVQLFVSDQFGCTDSLEQNVTVSLRPTISISVNDNCENEQFVFGNTSTIASGTIDTTHWNMGDGNSYSIASPTHIYTNFGTYTVSLYMGSALGCGSDTTFTVEVFPNPTAALQLTNVCDNNTVLFTEESFVPLPDVLLASDWAMGDGTVLNDTALTGYDYSTFGLYNVQLTVETANGCTDVAIYPVSVHAVPQADFSFADICETDSVQFSDASSIAQGTITTYDWTFGNGQTSSNQTAVQQSYPADDVYPVQLTVTSDSGCVSIFNDTIEIFPTPISIFTFDSVCFPLEVPFTDLSDPNGNYPITQWAWHFTDNQTSATQSPAIGFAQFGAYGAVLTVTNAAGCKDVFSLGDALVHPLPVAQFSANLEHCNEDTLVLTDQSTTDILSNDVLVTWNYTLADGTFIAQPSGTHIYADAGFYPVQLLVITNNGCRDSITETVEVYPLPTVDLLAEPSEGCEPLFVQFRDASSIPAPYQLAGWQWNLGDTNVASIQNPFITYAPQNLQPNDATTYSINLVVTSINGCASSINYPDLIIVHPLPDARFGTDPKIASIIRPIFEFTDLSTVNVIDWNWTFGDGNGSVAQNPTHTYPDSGSYNITLIVETAFSCADTISYTVKVEPHFSFYIPNAFSPNSDGTNDQFFGTGEYITQYNMQVFDRWGERLFESNSQNLRWDGTYLGKPVEAGQYIYRFIVRDWDAVQHEYTGGVKLIR